ncbi:uncharacterized protein BP5553_03971 [Venustampulla echinocandica]|uniref:Pathway-specific nitrogen regulator n=1 Tax=Venustampulla echinocandica TaxID=2656787 RepID=A0A370TVT3_9HELO|nr:uncharacterized protein BP5553_03971 [Venustampulla echinocandica]RDL39631.1 hypothetical protein BP5553_03971 [Venustampulla echinocandica]
MSPERVPSDQTVHQNSDSKDEHQGDEPADEHNGYDDSEGAQEARDRQLDRIEAQIQAAARAVVASIEQDSYGGNEDSVLSMQTDESYAPEGTEMTYGDTEITYEGTEITYDGTELTYEDTELTYESDNDHHSKAGKGMENAQAICESENEQHFEHERAETSSEAVAEPEEACINALDTSQGTVAKYEPDNELLLDHDQGGDSSSQHDGDIDDDVFSRDSGHSARSSLNSFQDLSNPEEMYSQKALTSPTVGEEAASSQEDDAISRIPSGGSYMHPIPDSGFQTPSKVHSRPPFRTPSSVRAMQMSSPTPSIFSSPRSVKRYLPTVSRTATPISHTSKNRTPTRFKAKKENPLVLLHVTVLPLQWSYSHLLSSPDLPSSLDNLKDSWRLLQAKLGDTVLERGVLLPHPQDSYEVLEERLLEALELPVRPRALILKCGHYMGPLETETPSSDDEGSDYRRKNGEQRKWCDICQRGVRLENGEERGRKRFRVKIYASNGLMHAGAWAAAWREMERVDVEIGPWVEPDEHIELEKLSKAQREPPVEEENDDGFVDEDIDIHHVHEHMEDEHEQDHQPSDLLERHPQDDNLFRQPFDRESEHQEHVDHQRKIDEDHEMINMLAEERMREVYGSEPSPMERPQSSRQGKSRARINEDSLADLLLAAFKVAMRDRKNVAILVLSLLVLILAIRPRMVVETELMIPIVSTAVPDILPNTARHAAPGAVENISVANVATMAPLEVLDAVTESLLSASTTEMAEQMPTQVAQVQMERPVDIAPEGEEILQKVPEAVQQDEPLKVDTEHKDDTSDEVHKLAKDVENNIPVDSREDNYEPPVVEIEVDSST